MGEDLAADIGAGLAGVLLAGLFVFVVLLARRWLLERGGGTVECGLRVVTRSTHDSEENVVYGPWRLGLARYSRDDLCWYRLFSISYRPMVVMRRRGLSVIERREPTADEAAIFTRDVTIVAVRGGDQEVEVALTTPALVGFLAWLEAAPPGFPVNNF